MSSQAPNNGHNGQNGTNGTQKQDTSKSPFAKVRASGGVGGIGFARSSLQVLGSSLGAGMQRLEMGLEDLGNTLSTEAERRNFDGRRLASFRDTVTESSVKIRDTVKDSVHGMAESETGTKIRSTVGEATSIVGERLQEVRDSSARAQSDDLEALRRRMQDEQQVLEAQHMTREAEEACLNVCRRHLFAFLEKKPGGTYEEWLRELHPENDYEGKLLEGFSELDHRFYVKESDHLKMWNESVDQEEAEGKTSARQKIEPRYRLGGHEEDTCTVDLLDMGMGPSSAAAAPTNGAAPATGDDTSNGSDDIFAELNGQGKQQHQQQQQQQESAGATKAGNAAQLAAGVDLLDLGDNGDTPKDEDGSDGNILDDIDLI